MGLLEVLKERSDNSCELCGAQNKLEIYQVLPVSSGGVDGSLLACQTCIEQINDPEKTDPHHWRCLNDSMRCEFEAVKVVVWRMLFRLKKEVWSQGLMDRMYLEDSLLSFAKATGEAQEASEKIIHRDVNGAQLESGDNVVLIKDLKVKGTSMTVKQGTAVRNICVDQ